MPSQIGEGKMAKIHKSTKNYNPLKKKFMWIINMEKGQQSVPMDENSVLLNCVKYILQVISNISACCQI